MQSRMDKFGRVLIPKKIRQAVGLRPGMALTLEESNGDIVLKADSQQNGLVLKQGVLVHVGQPEGDIYSFIETQREERIKNF